ncbi:zinc ribbon domain-containing protein [Sphingosinicellaceae bacterium]|nr:zinc ribbon domain-containing protein [Sphingosinicellaceae bacterium]
MTVDVPELRIIDDALAERLDAEFARRARPGAEVPPEARNRKRHLLSGLIKCGECGSNYTISGKDYYRCAGVKERGTCSNTVSVRQAPLEAKVLEVLRSELLTPALIQVFVREFEREVTRLSRDREDRRPQLQTRLKAVEAEIGNLAANMLEGVVGPTLRAMLAAREQERATLLAQIAEQPTSTDAVVLTHPTIRRRFEEKVANLQASLDDPAIRAEAAEQIAALIESVTVHPDGQQSYIEVEATTSKLIDFATNENNPRRGSGRGCSIAVVAGTGFEPVTFRL